jgi:predicted phage terminase large subunit-like protein
VEPGSFKSAQPSQGRALPLSRPEQIKARVRLRELELEQEKNRDRLAAASQQLEFTTLQEKALRDLYTFCVEIMGFTDLYEPLHRPLCETISDPSYIRKLTLIPRGHFKTTIISICYPAWRLTRDPNERIILSSANASKAQENLREIVQRLLSPQYQKYFGTRIPHPDAWLENNRDILWFPRANPKFTGPTIMCLGVDSAEVGRHASIMIVDDMVGKEQVNTPQNREKVWGWYGRQLAVLDPNCELNIVGTRWHEDDPYSRLQKKGDNWKKTIMKVREPWPNGEFIFPTRFDEQFLQEVTEDMDEYTFSCFYLNEPTGAGINPFDWNKFTMIDYPFKREYKKDRSREDNERSKPYTYILVDPAATTEDYSCPSGILVVDALEDKRLVIKEAILEKWNPDVLVENLFTLAKIHRPKAVVIEAEAQQLTYHFWLRREMFKRKLHFKVEEVKNPRNRTKPHRLRALVPFLHNGSFVFKGDMPGLNHIKEEFLTYPKGKHDDLICALYMAIPSVVFPPRYSRPDSRKEIPIRSRKLTEMVQRKRKPRGRAPRILLRGRHGSSIARQMAAQVERFSDKGTS